MKVCEGAMADDVGSLDYAGRTPVRAAANHGEGGENRALAEGCLAVVLLAGLLLGGCVVLVVLVFRGPMFLV